MTQTVKRHHWRPGTYVHGKGIYFGTWQPAGLGKAFNLFAAPHALSDMQGEREDVTFDAALTRAAEVKNLIGHDGTVFKSRKSLLKTLARGGYKGEWFIPPQELLSGTNGHGNPVQADNLSIRQTKNEALSSLFPLKKSFDPGEQCWSITRMGARRRTTNLSNGTANCVDKNSKSAVRLIRLEPRRG